MADRLWIVQGSDNGKGLRQQHQELHHGQSKRFSSRVSEPKKNDIAGTDHGCSHDVRGCNEVYQGRRSAGIPTSWLVLSRVSQSIALVHFNATKRV